MKEATGELNATVIVVIAVGVLMAFFYFTLWPILRSNFDRQANCAKAICDAKTQKDGYVTCHSKGKTDEFTCPYKG